MLPGKVNAELGRMYLKKLALYPYAESRTS